MDAFSDHSSGLDRLCVGCYHWKGYYVMERKRIYKWEYEQEMNDHARSEMFWALIEHLGLVVYSVEYDGCSPEYEFVKER